MWWVCVLLGKGLGWSAGACLCLPAALPGSTLAPPCLAELLAPALAPFLILLVLTSAFFPLPALATTTKRQAHVGLPLGALNRLLLPASCGATIGHCSDDA